MLLQHLVTHSGLSNIAEISKMLYFEHMVEHPYFMFMLERYTCINHPIHLFCWWSSVIASQI